MLREMNNHLLIETLKLRLESGTEKGTSVCKPDSTCAAVLIPIVCSESQWSLLFTRRTANVSSHQNEVSFPGGSYEKLDVTLENTALRETFEEIGVEKERIAILGRLPISNTITGFNVFPYVGVLTEPRSIRMNKDEVDSVFSIPITWLEDPANYYEADYLSPQFGLRRVIHYREYEGEHLWGYTARLTLQLLMLLK